MLSDILGFRLSPVQKVRAPHLLDIGRAERKANRDVILSLLLAQAAITETQKNPGLPADFQNKLTGSVSNLHASVALWVQILQEWEDELQKVTTEFDPLYDLADEKLLKGQKMDSEYRELQERYASSLAEVNGRYQVKIQAFKSQYDSASADVAKLLKQVSTMTNGTAKALLK